MARRADPIAVLSRLHLVLTGSSGFVGSNLLAWLARDPSIRVTTIGRRASGRDGVDERIVPAMTPEAIDDCLGGVGFDALVHLAAAGVHPNDRDWTTLASVNSMLPGQLVSLAVRRGARAMIMAGSSAEYRQPAPTDTTPLTESAPLETGKLYGATKAAGSLLALCAATAGNLPLAVLRFFNLYGAGEAPHRLLPSLASQLQRGEKVALSPGLQVRDFVHVDDACAGIVAALEGLIGGTLRTGAYNLASGRGHTVAQFARTVAASMGAGEDRLDFGALPMRPDDVPFLVGDASALRRQTGWSPKLSLQQGIAASLNTSSSPSDR